jgi:hypothetical protein
MNALGRATFIRAGILSLIALISSVASHAAFAQQSTVNLAPQIIVSASAEVLLPPAKATFSIGILTTAQAAATAGNDNARISKAVVDALIRAGLKHDEITGTRLDVRPHWEYDDNGQHPRRSAFEASNTIQIATENLAQIGIYIDAALSAGATDSSEIAFTAKNVDEARHQALGQAVLAARADAEAMARAGGGALGEVLLLSTDPANEFPGGGLSQMAVTARRSRGPVSTEVIPDQITVSAHVVTHWRFVSATMQK